MLFHQSGHVVMVKQWQRRALKCHFNIYMKSIIVCDTEVLTGDDEGIINNFHHMRTAPLPLILPDEE